MTEAEMQEILSECLSKFKTWNYSQFVEHIKKNTGIRRIPLNRIEEVSTGRSRYLIKINAFWDDKYEGNIKVTGDFFAEPKKRLFKWLPIYFPHLSGSFIVTSSGELIEKDKIDVKN